jgi:hopene-associated glycosyltransferase HpnB
VIAAEVAAAIALTGWVWLALARGGYWRTDVRLPQPSDPTSLEHWPTVAILTPARDEIDVLPRTVPALLGQDYAGRFRVIVADDGSTDGTGALLKREWPDVSVVAPGEPPHGWAGKLWALRAAAAEADIATGAQPGCQSAKADYLLLTDADIVHRSDSLRALVQAAETGGYALVSQMARLRAETGWERLIVPAFVYFFALLFPFRWSNDPAARTAAAAGGCVLVRRDALERAGGFEAIHDAIIDDVALADAVKGAGGRTFLGLGDRVDSIRAYPRLSSLWAMVSRSAFAQLNHSLWLLAGTVAGLALMFWAPVAALIGGVIAGDSVLAALGGAAWALMTALYAPMIRYYRLPWWLSLTLPFTATLYLAMTVTSAIQHYRGAGGAWKGRTYD